MKKLGKISLLIGSALITGLPTFAAQMSPTEALQRALFEGTSDASDVIGMFRAPGSRSLSDYQLTKTYRSDDMNTMYVFTGPESRGYMIVAADDQAGALLLGYSEDGVFDMENMPENMKWFLDCASHRVAARVAEGNNPYALSFASATRNDIAPLCATKWNQDAPYWNMCPKDKGSYSYTGCAATALAQIMKVHNWPDKGVGQISYTSGSLGTISVNFSESVYDWDNMLNSYTSTATTAQKDAVAKLMFDCGAGMKMQYSADASGATVPDAAQALVNYFKYSKSVRSVNREVYSYGDFVQLIYNELAVGCPVLFGGSNYMNGYYYGHAFVADGYRTNGDYFHINWGWGGMSDGYFLLTALDPDSQGAGGSAAGYNMNTTVIIGIAPDRDGTSQGQPNLFCNTPFVTSATTYNRSSNVTFLSGGNGRGVFNFTTYPSTIIIRPGVKLVSEDGSEERTLTTTQSYQMAYQTGFISYNIPASNFPTDGNWIVTPGFQYDNKWYDMPMDIAVNRAMSLEASNTQLRFAPATQLPVLEVVEFDAPSNGYLNVPFQVSAKVKAVNGEVYSRLALVVLSATGSNVLAVVELQQIDILDGETGEYNWVTCLTTSGGFRASSYRLAICNVPTSATSYTPLSGGVSPISLSAKPATEYSVGSFTLNNVVSGNGASTFNPAVISLDDFSANLSLSVTSGFFADQVSTVIFNRAGTSSITQTKPQFVEIEAGESKTVKMTGNFVGALEVNTTYLAVPFGNYSGQLGSDMKYIRATAAGVEFISEDEANKVTIYPNPVEIDFTVSAPTVVETVDVYNMSGQCVARVKGSADMARVDLSAAPAGLYIVRILLADGSIINRQIVKR